MGQLTESTGESVETACNPAVSFVIPARNEERYVAATICSIAETVAGAFEFEIIVVDNASTDGTAVAARRHGATVVHAGGGTIGYVRNLGAQRARGDIIVFLDADVTIRPSWLPQFLAARFELRGSDLVMAGSACTIPEDASWLERVWFEPRTRKIPTYFGGAHVVIARDRFLALGGFDETLETGEDYDLSVRVSAHGGRLMHMDADSVVHHGYPKSISRFVKREVWHGAGDSQSLRRVLQSKVASFAILFLILHVSLLISALALQVGAIVLFVILIAVLCLASAYRAVGGQSVSVLLGNSALYYLYFGARCMSFLRAWRSKPLRQQHGEHPQLAP